MIPKISNLKKQTPEWAVRLSNGIIYAVLSVQPLIAGAPAEVMSIQTKFWISVALAGGAGLFKGYTALLGEDKNEQN